MPRSKRGNVFRQLDRQDFFYPFFTKKSGSNLRMHSYGLTNIYFRQGPKFTELRQYRSVSEILQKVETNVFKEGSLIKSLLSFISVHDVWRNRVLLCREGGLTNRALWILSQDLCA